MSISQVFGPSFSALKLLRTMVASERRFGIVHKLMCFKVRASSKCFVTRCTTEDNFKSNFECDLSKKVRPFHMYVNYDLETV